MIHKVQDGLQVCILDPLEVEEGVLVGVAAQNVAEEGGAGGQNDLVGLQLLLIITAQSYVEKIFVIPELAECHTNITFKVVPSQAKLFRPHVGSQYWHKRYYDHVQVIPVRVSHNFNN
jgi:hypothetical protein